ncbi:hypothetical protein QBC40DRAFT_284523, partial [Triangularia verruculosa]
METPLPVGFSHYPWEIRRLVYEHVFPRRLHLYRNESGQWTHARCEVDPAAPPRPDEDLLRVPEWLRHTLTSPPPKWFWHSWMLRLDWGTSSHWQCQAPRHQHCDTTTARYTKSGGSSFISLLLTSKLVYQEAIIAMSETTTLIFTSSEDAYDFTVTNPYPHLSKLRSIEFTFASPYDSIYVICPSVVLGTLTFGQKQLLDRLKTLDSSGQALASLHSTDGSEISRKELIRMRTLFGALAHNPQLLMWVAHATGEEKDRMTMGSRRLGHVSTDGVRQKAADDRTLAVSSMPRGGQELWDKTATALQVLATDLRDFKVHIGQRLILLEDCLSKLEMISRFARVDDALTINLVREYFHPDPQRNQVIEDHLLQVAIRYEGELWRLPGSVTLTFWNGDRFVIQGAATGEPTIQVNSSD